MPMTIEWLLSDEATEAVDAMWEKLGQVAADSGPYPLDENVVLAGARVVYSPGDGLRVPLYELGRRAPVAYLEERGEVTAVDARRLPRILFADVEKVVHLSWGITVAPLDNADDCTGPLTPERAATTLSPPAILPPLD